jgi:hypothetical protein
MTRLAVASVMSCVAWVAFGVLIADNNVRALSLGEIWLNCVV